MSSKHEQELEHELKQTRHHPVPPSIDDFIFHGLKKGKKRKSQIDFMKNSVLSLVAVCLFFILSVNFIPGVSQIAGTIPGLQKIVEIVKYDKGLKDAINNDYVQVIGASDSKNGITLTVDNVIIDKRRLLVFYTVETEEEYIKVGLTGSDIFTDDNHPLTEYGLGSNRLELNGSKGSGMLDFSWNEDQAYSKELILKTDVVTFDNTDGVNGKEIAGGLTIAIPIDLEKVKHSITYEINQTKIIEGQSIYFEKLISYPTRQVLYLEYDEENSKEILSLIDLHIENELGEVVAESSGATIDGNKRIISLTGNYFAKENGVNIVLTKVMALDKGKLEVQVDTEKHQLLEAPDKRFTLRDISEENFLGLDDTLAINFDLAIDEAEHPGGFFVLSGSFTDGSGIKYNSNSQSSSAGEFSIYIEDRDYDNPLTFDIQQYPSYIEGDIRIKVK